MLAFLHVYVGGLSCEGVCLKIGSLCVWRTYAIVPYGRWWKKWRGVV